MLDIDADIVPGVGEAGITLGQTVEELLALGMTDDVDPLIAKRVLDFGPVRAYDDDTGIIEGISVKSGYRGKIEGKIGIGSRIAEVIAVLGSIEYTMMGEYQIAKGTPWLNNDWTFIVEKDGYLPMGEPGWDDACIESIWVGR